MALIDEQVQRSIAQREATSTQFLNRAKTAGEAPPAGLPQQGLPQRNVGLQGEQKNPRGLLSGASGELGQIFNFFAEIKQRKGLRQRAEQFADIRARIVRESGATADERADPITRAKFSLKAADAMGDPELIGRSIDAIQKAMILAASRDLETAQKKAALAKAGQADATTAKLEAETEHVAPKAKALAKQYIATAELKEGQLKDLKPKAKDRATTAAASKLSAEASMLRSKAAALKTDKEAKRVIAGADLTKKVTQQLAGMPFMQDKDLSDKNSEVVQALQQMAFHVANSIEGQMRITPGIPFGTAFNNGFEAFKKFMSADERGGFKKFFGIGDEAATFDVSGAIGNASDTVKVIDPQGKPGSIPRAQLEAALKQGYKEAK